MWCCFCDGHIHKIQFFILLTECVGPYHARIKLSSSSWRWVISQAAIWRSCKFCAMRSLRSDYWIFLSGSASLLCKSFLGLLAINVKINYQKFFLVRLINSVAQLPPKVLVYVRLRHVETHKTHRRSSFPPSSFKGFFVHEKFKALTLLELYECFKGLLKELKQSSNEWNRQRKDYDRSFATSFQHFKFSQ